jgi:ATP-dependent DNA helicase RecQ
MENATVFQSSFNRDNLYYEVRSKSDPDKDIIKLLQPHKGKSGIIYCLSRQKVEELAQTLQVNGINALPYHAGLDSGTRVKHQDAFLMEDCDIIVATIAFGMGIDKPDVRFVLHYDMPKSLESYYQETGRAGRDGGEGNCITFYSFKDIEKLEKFLSKKPVSEQEVGKQLLQDSMGYAEYSGCRRKYLLHYFGEEYDDSQCTNMCDNCRFPRKKYDAQEDLVKVFKVIEESFQKFKSPQVCNVLIGNMTAILKTHNASSMDMWAKGKEKSDKHWSYVIRQAIVQDYLIKEIESYGILKLTDKSKAYLANPEPFIIPEETDFGGSTVAGGSDKGGKGAALDQKLYNQLKEETRRIAKSKKVPPYAVFSENSLNEMATVYPCNLEELQNISGVGTGKAKKFGRSIVELIAEYVEQNGIERPLDLVFKSVANKSVLKVYIIQSTDRKLPLGDIASAKGLSMDELMNEMEIIVNSGTKIDIDYYLEDILDEESIDEIFDFFMEDAEDGSVKEAIDEFGSDFSEEEIRLVRLKFMSDVAN